VDATINIDKPLTALLCFGTTPKIDSSNYTSGSQPGVNLPQG